MNFLKLTAIFVLSFSLIGCIEQLDDKGRVISGGRFYELKSEDLVVGEGAEAKTGDTIRVHYVGTLSDGTEFDSNSEGEVPLEFTLGQGGVIQGWDQGIPGMKVGGKRKLSIPSDLAYGKAGNPPVIGPDEPLFFEVELVEIVPPATE